MRIHIICTALPPQLDGIGDYTSMLASELAGNVCIKILTSEDLPYAPIPGVEIQSTFSVESPSSMWQIGRTVEADRPDWVLLQYNPFSYGRRGLNLQLPQVMARLKRLSPQTRFALMAHEHYVPVIDWKFAVMTTWQRWQFWKLGQAADTVFVSTDPWTQTFGAWFPGKPVLHLPVGSNIPRVTASRTEVRAQLGIGDDRPVIGLFGTAHPSRMLGLIRDSTLAARRSGHDALVLYVGPHGPAVRAALGDLPLICEGPLPANEVSRRFAAMDIYLAPFVDGVSTRRGSFLTGIQHGLPTLGTDGAGTDRLLRAANGKAYVLTDVRQPGEFTQQLQSLLQSPERRQELGREAGQFYQQEFAWARIAARLLAALR